MFHFCLFHFPSTNNSVLKHSIFLPLHNISIWNFMNVTSCEALSGDTQACNNQWGTETDLLPRGKLKAAKTEAIFFWLFLNIKHPQKISQFEAGNHFTALSKCYLLISS